MIKISELTKEDIGRNVIYHRKYCDRQIGTLSSWNHLYLFVKFKGPNGEACTPCDVSFEREIIKTSTS
jgi:hypothetical protein